MFWYFGHGTNFSFCGTRMAHFLDTCEVFVKILPAVYDSMYTLGIKAEERDKLFTAENVFMIYLCDVQIIFKGSYLRVVDQTNLLAPTVYRLAVTAAENTKEAETTKANLFKKTFHQTIKRQRNKTQDEVIEGIKENLDELKSKILDNIADNINDQCNENTPFYNWSAWDLEEKSPMEVRLQKLRELNHSFINERRHEVMKYADASEK